MLFEDKRARDISSIGVGDLIQDSVGKQYLIIFDSSMAYKFKLVNLKTMEIDRQYKSLMDVNEQYHVIASREELTLVASDI